MGRLLIDVMGSLEKENVYPTIFNSCVKWDLKKKKQKF